MQAHLHLRSSQLPRKREYPVMSWLRPVRRGEHLDIQRQLPAARHEHPRGRPEVQRAVGAQLRGVLVDQVQQACACASHSLYPEQHVRRLLAIGVR